jgi:hypothetical protein
MTEDEQTLIHNMPSHMTETAVTCDKPYRQYAKVGLYNAYGFQHDVYDGVNYPKRFHHNNGLRIGGLPSQSTFQHRSFAFDMISNDLFYFPPILIYTLQTFWTNRLVVPVKP